MNMQFLFALAFIFSTLLATATAQAGVPFINLEGVGGVAFNPLAYPAGTPAAAGEAPLSVAGIEISKPSIGAWYVNLNDTDIDWTTIGIADTIGKRLELSYGYESVAIGGVPENTHKYNIGGKFLLLEENAFDSKWVPAVAVGTIYKRTAFNVASDVDNRAFDYYLVATKLITQLPRPVLVSGGVLSTRGQVNGILGFNDERDELFFGNIDILPLDNLAIGFEFKQGTKLDNYQDANYWNVHAGWLVNKNLSLILAYADAGDRHSTSKVGLGGGTVLSVQYAF